RGRLDVVVVAVGAGVRPCDSPGPRLRQDSHHRDPLIRAGRGVAVRVAAGHVVDHRVHERRHVQGVGQHARARRWARAGSRARVQYVDQNGNVVSREERVERPASERFLDQPYSVPTYDHVDQFFHPGGYSTNSISIAQNGATTNFFASYTRRDTEGVIQAHGGFKMDDVRLSCAHRRRSGLSCPMSAYHWRSGRDSLPDNTFLDLAQTAPDSDLLQPDPGGTPFISRPDPIGATSNPLYELA